MSGSNTRKLTKIISNLGGPAIADTDIEWALDLPAGRKLVDWLAAQLDNEEEDEGDTIPIDEEIEYDEILRAIALEAGEVDILKYIGPPETADTNDTRTMPLGYLPPLRLKKQAEHMNNEAHLWEEEAQVLKSRLQQTKLVSQKMTQTMKSLQAAIEREDLDIAQRQDRLAELSLHGDTTISSTVKGAQSLLDTIGCASGPEPTTQDCGPTDTEVIANLASAVASLSNLASLRSSITDLHTFQLEQIEEAYLKVPSLDVIKADAARLQSVLTPQFDQSASEAVFLQELEDACKLLESVDVNDDTLEQILGRDARPGIDLRQELDVNDVLETAWSLDQAAILEARGKVLDITISEFKNNLIEPLAMLQQSLFTIEKQIRDSEALIGALGVELEEVVDDIRCAKENSEVIPRKSIKDTLDEDLEAKLLDLLKNLKDLRPPDSPPLVLLGQADIIEELASLTKRIQALQERENLLSAGLPLTLSTTKSMHAPFLSKVYEHSPVNTSPPFALPPDISRLQDGAKHKGEDLGTNVGRLQKEMELLMESSRTKRKLGTFTDKWHKETR